MNNEEFKKLVDSLNLPKEDYYILGSGSLLLYGIREVANDLDLCISEELFEILKDKYNINMNSQNECGFYPLIPNVEVVVNSKDTFDNDFVDGYPVEKITSILKYKEIRNKPKDQNDILKIKKYLE